MRREDVQAFHVVANPVRDAVYGSRAMWNGREIFLACNFLSEMELAAGGWEKAGTIRALLDGIEGPKFNDWLSIEDPRFARVSERWVVKSVTPAPAHNTLSLTLEPTNAAE